MNLFLFLVGLSVVLSSVVSYLGYVIGKRKGEKIGMAMARGEFFDRVTNDMLVFGNSFVRIQRLNPESVRLTNVRKPYGQKQKK